VSRSSRSGEEVTAREEKMDEGFAKLNWMVGILLRKVQELHERVELLEQKQTEGEDCE
jgi:hypothetical protein